MKDIGVDSSGVSEQATGTCDLAKSNPRNRGKEILQKKKIRSWHVLLELTIPTSQHRESLLRGEFEVLSRAGPSSSLSSTQISCTLIDTKNRHVYIVGKENRNRVVDAGNRIRGSIPLACGLFGSRTQTPERDRLGGTAPTQTSWSNLPVRPPTLCT